jgi:hypothetical protein
VSASLPIGGTGVELQLETRGGGHIEEIVGALRAEGYPVQLMP